LPDSGTWSDEKFSVRKMREVKGGGRGEEGREGGQKGRSSRLRGREGGEEREGAKKQLLVYRA
jgi:hypothetical protein